MTAQLTDRRCHCCGKRSVWIIVKVTQEACYRVYLCFACDLVPAQWTDPQEDGPF